MKTLSELRQAHNLFGALGELRRTAAQLSEIVLPDEDDYAWPNGTDHERFNAHVRGVKVVFRVSATAKLARICGVEVADHIRIIEGELLELGFDPNSAEPVNYRPWWDANKTLEPANG